MTGLMGLLLVTALAETPAEAVRDAGLAVVVAGEVQVRGTGQEQATALVPFAKVRVGDELSVSEGAQVELAWFEGGGRERWEGPARLRVGASAAEAVQGEPAARQDGDEVLGRNLESLQLMLQRAELDRAGQTRVRAPETAVEAELDEAERARATEARRRHQARRAEASDDDILPEMLLASDLLRLGLTAEAAEVLDGAVSRCGGCEPATTLRAWVQPR